MNKKDVVLFMLGTGRFTRNEISVLMRVSNSYIYKLADDFFGKNYLRKKPATDYGIFYELTERGEEYLRSKYGENYEKKFEEVMLNIMKKEGG